MAPPPPPLARQTETVSCANAQYGFAASVVVVFCVFCLVRVFCLERVLRSCLDEDPISDRYHEASGGIGVVVHESCLLSEATSSEIFRSNHNLLAVIQY